MRRNTFINTLRVVVKPSLTIGLLILTIFFGGVASSSAQVKRVQMHIAGYLCGN
jgi:hypothetical protein